MLLLAACSGQPTPPAAIRIRWPRDPEGLDPLTQRNQSAIDASNLLQCSLLHRDPGSLADVPVLADSLPVVGYLPDSSMTLRYQLRPAARWDDGRPVLATDVAFTLKLMSCPGLPNEGMRSQFDFVRAIELDARNPRWFRLRCQGHSPQYLSASGDYSILSEARLDPHHRLRRYSLAQLQQLPPTPPADTALLALGRLYQALDLTNHPERAPGCGPYRLVRWEKDRYLSFRRKPDWWARRLPRAPVPLQAHAPQLDYVIIPDATTALLALRRGTLDVLPQVPARDFARLQADTASPGRPPRCYTTASYDVAIAGFNTRRPALADAATRRALSRLFDAEGLRRATQLGAGQRSVGLVNPLDRTNYNDSLPLTPYAPATAAALLRAAGWQRQAATGWARPTPRGRQRLALAVRYRTGDELMSTIALQFRAAAQQQGIAVSLVPTESGQFEGALQGGDFDVYLRIMRGNPFNFNFTPILHSSAIGEGNQTGFGTPASDRLIAATAAAQTMGRRTRLLRQLQALLQQEAPLVPLFFLPSRIATAPGLTGLHVSSLKPGFTAATIHRLAAPPPAR